MRVVALLLMTVVLVAGCQTPQPRDPDSPYFAPPAGSRLTLEKPVEVPAGDAAVHIQAGRVMHYNDLDRYEPHCKFELRTVAAEARTVRPDTFVVERVERFSRSVRRTPEEPVRVAAAGRSGGLVIGRESEGGPFADIMTTRLVLRSERQPDVFRMECMHWDQFEFSQHLSVNQMRTTLKDLFTLVLPQER